jgi:protein-S-isoprenylcysteine O-methyltransferase Ste14
VVIDLHKGLTPLVMLGLMAWRDNWSAAAWLYLALHGGYGLLWVLKSQLFPDPSWEQRIGPVWIAITSLGLVAYWSAGFLLIHGGWTPPPWLMGLSALLVVMGTFLHFGSDAQKYFVLRARKGLIQDGFFARTRNPNYLGEMLIYSGFAALSGHWLPWLVNLGFWLGFFLPNMLRKDRSMSRYPEWAAYTAKTGLLLPRIW